MKVFSLCLILLIITPSFAVKARKPTLASIQKYDAIRKTKNNWASIAIELAFLQVQAGGPVDTLVNAIEDVVVDLGKKRTYADNQYVRRTDEHNSEIRRLNDAVNSAISDITTQTEYLENVLYKQQAQFEEEIVHWTNEIATKEAHLVQIQEDRELTHNAFLTMVEEHNGAMGAIDECLGILEQLHESGELSLAQIKRGKNSMNKVVDLMKKFKKGTDHAIMVSLVNLASSFANQDALGRVEDMFNEVKNNLLASLVKITQQEEDSVAAYNDDVANTNLDIQNASSALEESQSNLAETNNSIEETKDFIEQRKADKAGFEAEIEAENAQFEEDTRIYEDLCAQFDKETAACELALQVLSEGEFAGYIGDRMESDKVIDTNHGEEISTGAGTFDFQGENPRMD